MIDHLPTGSSRSSKTQAAINGLSGLTLYWSFSRTLDPTLSARGQRSAERTFGALWFRELRKN
jgi:hypothetical protein